MPRRVRILPDFLVNQIAAGEVVERPGSVVKELVENALDAGAGRVEISIQGGGKTEVRVADDGCGMGREDALLCLDRHATSKIKDERDLAGVVTLGFRGEALPSIAAVSRMTLETAEQGGDGTRLRISAGRLHQVEACARQRGTTVTVRNLFHNTPARGKFLRPASAEARAVSEQIVLLSLAAPATAFRLESNGRALADLAPAGEVRSRVADLWGSEWEAGLMPFAHQGGSAALTGLIERPHRATPGSRRAYLFVNGRPIRDSALAKAVDRAYRTTVAERVRPSFFLFLEVPKEQVDMNVHPAKLEVRFRDAVAVERLVEDGVRRALGEPESTPALGQRAGAEYHPAGLPPLRVREPGPPAGGESTSQMSLFVPAASKGAESGGEGGEGELAGGEMWQLHDRYILAGTRSGLVIVDQHAAHERVLYEEIVSSFESDGCAAGQHLLFPITLRLSPAEHAVAGELAGVLARAGFELESFGGHTVLIRAVPNPHAYFDAERCVREMLAELTEGSPLVNAARNQHQRVALSFACKAAIKAGQTLSRGEMAELFDRLFATELPYHDVHGRPTVIQLSLTELDRRFGRS
ncbi:MAG: DNA mismatch repair endonuclease MutL [Longimicrobiaceae bacterium]